MAACRTELDAQRIRDGQQRVADAALRLPPLPAGTPQGFVPYYQRKEAGTADRKRLSAETLRTLESLYDRTPFPSNDMIR